MSLVNINYFAFLFKRDVVENLPVCALRAHQILDARYWILDKKE
jgi:hypothetical protein